MAKKIREKIETKSGPSQKLKFKSKQKFNCTVKQDQCHSKFRANRVVPDTSKEDSFFLKSESTVKNSVVSDNGQNPQATSKKFDKKLWRLKKYSNKYKLQQWEEMRKKAVLRDYQKTLKHEDSKFDVQKIYQEFEQDGDEGEKSSSQSTSKKRFKNARERFEDIHARKQAQKEEWLKRKAEKQEAIREYKRKKLEKFKKLSRKTKKGQPIMKNRIEILLEKIQSSINT